MLLWILDILTSIYMALHQMHYFHSNDHLQLRKKGMTTFTDILESLPNIFSTGLGVGLVFVLVQFSPDKVSVR